MSESTPAPTAPTASPPSTAGPSGTATPDPATVLSHRAVRAVVAALEAANASVAAAGVRVLPFTAPTAATAAEQLGCGVGAIANSLVFEAGGQPLLVLTSGAHRVDTKLLGPRIGLSKSAIKRAKPEFVKIHTGQAIGGVAPVGHPARVRTLVDEELKNFPVVWAAAGHHMAVFPTDFETLVRITEGEVVKVD